MALQWRNDETPALLAEKSVALTMGHGGAKHKKPCEEQGRSFSTASGNSGVHNRAGFLDAMSQTATAVSIRKRTSTALHALAAETPTAKAKVRDHTDTGDVRP